MYSREQILSMEPGRELDALVAEKVMGWRVENKGGIWGWMYSEPDRNRWHNCPRFSAYIMEAWEVVEKMAEDFYQIDISVVEGETVCNVWESDIKLVASAEGRAPEAISKAALLSLIGEESA